MATSTRLLILAPLLLAVAACGSDDDSSDSAADAPVATEAATADDDATTDTAPSDADASGSEDDASDSSGDPATPPADGGGGGATLTLDNGETIEFSSVLCTLEPQMAAGSEILFTAVSYGDPGLDITQFGDEGTITGVASISVYDADYESLWEANTMFGSEVELTLDGSTIRGTGSFLEGGDIANAPVSGEIVANC
jgi:hypothetical protein